MNTIIYKNFLFSLLAIFLSISARAQYYTSSIRIDSANRSYLFGITEDAIKTASFKYYYWFKSGHIHVTQGSYYGKLLHGNYKVIDSANNLLEEGEFKNGLKTGLWRTWYVSGVLKSSRKKYFRIFGTKYKIRDYDSSGQIIKRVNEN